MSGIPADFGDVFTPEEHATITQHLHTAMEEIGSVLTRMRESREGSANPFAREEVADWLDLGSAALDRAGTVIREAGV